MPVEAKIIEHALLGFPPFGNFDDIAPVVAIPATDGSHFDFPAPEAVEVGI